MKPKEVYLIWNDWDDSENHYWEQYDSLKDAVDSCEYEPVEVFKAEPKSLGYYKTKVSTVKVKKPKEK